MAAAESPTSSPFNPIYMPLIIALSIIASVVLALLALHSLMVRLCSRYNTLEASAAAALQRGRSVAGGVERRVLEAIPVHAYTKRGRALGLEQLHECSVCLGELKEGDLVRFLPNCGHGFHVSCVDAWLAFHSSCPLCRCVVAVAGPETSVGCNRDGGGGGGGGGDEVVSGNVSPPQVRSGGGSLSSAVTFIWIRLKEKLKPRIGWFSLFRGSERSMDHSSVIHDV